MLASEYGWSKDKILTEVYPDELFALGGFIKRRHVNDIIIQLRVAMNPHLEAKDQKEFAEELQKELEGTIGFEVNEQPLDVEAFQAFKSSLQGTGSQLAAK